jgi:hypothetical protein
MTPDQVTTEVSTFMQSHAAGWIRENDALMFFEQKCAFIDICISLSQLKDEQKLNILLDFLENVARFESVGNHLTDESAQAFLSAAVQSPSERLRGVIVTALSSVKRPSFPFEVNEDVLFSLLIDEDTGISVRTSKLVLEWIEKSIQAANEKLTYVLKVISMYKSRHGRLNETQEFRFISLFIDIAKLDANFFEAIRTNNLLDPIIARFLSTETDLLVKLGSLTFIESLAQFENGQKYLAESKVLGALEKELSGPLADSTTVISLILSISSIVPFVSSTEQVRSILVYPQAQVPRTISQFLISPNNAERMCAMKALACVSEAAGRSEPVDTYLRSSWRLMKELTFAISDVDVEVVNTALDSVRSLIKNWDRNPFMESPQSQAGVIAQVFETFKRHPFPECRCLVYALLSTIVMFEELSDQGLSIILSEPSPIRAALLDYQSESNYESRRAKCDFVRVLVNMESKGILKKYFKKDQVENLIDFADKGLEWVPVTKAKDEMETEAL